MPSAAGRHIATGSWPRTCASSRRGASSSATTSPAAGGRLARRRRAAADAFPEALVNRALFLDRDGVIDALVLHDDGEWGAPLRPEDLRLLPGATEAMKTAASNGWLLFVVTNQPDAAKRKTTQASLHAVHDELLRQLGDAPVTEFFYCFHRAEDLCACRKPSPYFVQHAARYHNVDLAQSWLVGDSDTDVEGGRRAGCT